MDLGRVASLREEATQAFTQVSETCVRFLTGDQALRPIAQELTAIEAQISELAETRCRLRQLIDLCDHGDGSACLQLRLVGS